MDASVQHILELAPHPGIFKDAQELAKSGKWKSLGSDGQLLWGMIKSKRIKYFKVLIDMTQDAFYSSSPNRKQPSADILALWLMYLEEPEDWPSEQPEWVPELIGKLQKKGTIVLDPEQAAKNAEARSQSKSKRIEVMQQGMLELEAWIEDLIEQGLAQTDAKNAGAWEMMAARLVDSKLGGIARIIRTFPIKQQSEDWPDELFKSLSWLYSLAKGFRQLDHLPLPLQDDLLQLGGLNIRKDQLPQKMGIEDDWLVLSLIEGEEDRLYFRRTWFYGAKSGRFGLVLDFVFGQQQFDQVWKVGQTFSGKLVFYPGAVPTRAALFQSNRSALATLQIKGVDDFDSLRKKYAIALQKNPWLNSIPAILNEFKPVQDPVHGWILVDRTMHWVQMDIETKAAWKLLAVSGGQGVMVFGVWNGNRFQPGSILTARGVLPLA